MPSAPLFSIITVTYNAGHTVGRTLDSVAAQTCPLYEHIVIDGKSTDNTMEIVAAAAAGERRRTLSEPDLGLYDAMNKGLGMARGDYLIFLNAGDKFHSPQTLSLLADIIMRNDYPGLVYGQTDLVDDEGRYVGPRHLTAPEELKYEDFARGMLVCHQAFVVLRRLTPLYDMKYRFSADYDWCIRCLQHSKRNIYAKATLIDYLSEGMTTANRRKSLVERFKIMSFYYGFWPTLMRHGGFVFRALGRKLKNHKK